MKSKKIMVTLSGPPIGENSITEYLRAALGITAGYRQHKVDVLFTGDSVFIIKMPREQKALEKFLRTSNLLELKLYLDEESLMARKIDREIVKEPFKVAGRDELFQLYNEAEMTASF